jgi:PRC-barrel domain
MTAADYLSRGSGVPYKMISWFAFRFAVYAGVLGLTAILFLVGAGVYARFWTADIASVPTREFLSNPQPAPPMPEKELEGTLVAGNPDLFSGVPNLFGLEIVDSGNVPVGKISDIILDRNGKVQSMVVALNGYWLTRKYVIIPFKDFTFKTETIANRDTNPPVVTRGTVPYALATLQALPPAREFFHPGSVEASPKEE